MAHKQALLSEMDGLEEPAAVLHLASLVLFQTVTQSMLHASGKFVSSILAFLEPHLPPDTFSHLREFHGKLLLISFFPLCPMLCYFGFFFVDWACIAGFYFNTICNFSIFSTEMHSC